MEGNTGKLGHSTSVVSQHVIQNTKFFYLYDTCGRCCMGGVMKEGEEKHPSLAKERLGHLCLSTTDSQGT